VVGSGVGRVVRIPISYAARARKYSVSKPREVARRPRSTENTRKRLGVTRKQTISEPKTFGVLRRICGRIRMTHERVRRTFGAMRKRRSKAGHRLVHESARQTAEELRREAEKTRQIVQDVAISLHQVAEMQPRIVAQIAPTTQVLR